MNGLIFGFTLISAFQKGRFLFSLLFFAFVFGRGRRPAEGGKIGARAGRAFCEFWPACGRGCF